MRLLWFVPLALSSWACSPGPCGGPPPESGIPADHVLLHPDSAALKAIPPDSFDVRFETSEGDVVVRVQRAWAPLGAYRFYNLVRNGFYDGSRFYRVLPGFAAQFGANGTPVIDAAWSGIPLPDDPRRVLNEAGTIAYAMNGPNTRTTHLFFNYRNNEPLDQQGFAPFGRVVEGMGVLYRLFGEYGELQPQGGGPSFGCVMSHGNAYLSRRYPELDSIVRATVLEPAG